MLKAKEVRFGGLGGGGPKLGPESRPDLVFGRDGASFFDGCAHFTDVGFHTFRGMIVWDFAASVLEGVDKLIYVRSPLQVRAQGKVRQSKERKYVLPMKHLHLRQYGIGSAGKRVSSKSRGLIAAAMSLAALVDMSALGQLAVRSN